MSDMAWLWLAGVAALFGMACAIAWRDNVGGTMLIWARWRIVGALDAACTLTRHRWCHVFAASGIRLADRWGLYDGE